MVSPPARPVTDASAAPGEPPAPRRPSPRDVPRRTPLVARPVGAAVPDPAQTDDAGETPRP